MKISLYLSPSKYWWGYLAIRSNPDLLRPLAHGGIDRVIFFENLAGLPPRETSRRNSNQYFYICWDGLTAESETTRVRDFLGDHLTVLVVGEDSVAAGERCQVRNLYTEGEFRFTAVPGHFGMRTKILLFGARIKTLVMPFKNLLPSRADFREGIDLLFGKQRIVFCGSYGTIPKVIGELCRRHSVDPQHFDGYEYYLNAPMHSFETYLEYLQRNGEFLANLFDRGKLSSRFFQSAVHLLGREYLIERIRFAGLDLFVHGYASGTNINVYTTPFYRQHVFLDFGSAAGKGNYPRLADLRYFRKRVVAFEIDGEAEATAAMARSGQLAQYFEDEWKRKSPQLVRAMR